MPPASCSVCESLLAGRRTSVLERDPVIVAPASTQATLVMLMVRRSVAGSYVVANWGRFVAKPEAFG